MVNKRFQNAVLGCNLKNNKMISVCFQEWCWSWNSNTLATSCKELTHWKRPWCWEGLGAGGEGDDRGWDGWMASPTRLTYVWLNSGSWWWTGRPGVLQFMGSQRVRHDWATELNRYMKRCSPYHLGNTNQNHNERLSICGTWALVGSSWARNQTRVSCTGRQIIYHWTSREALEYILLKLSSQTPLQAYSISWTYLNKYSIQHI